MRVRRLTATVVVTLTAAGATGCGGGGGDEKVRVYGSSAVVGGGGDIARGMQLALAEAGGRAGEFEVELVSLDASRADSDRPGFWEPDAVRQNARKAVDDERAVAYIGDQHSGASEVSLPVTHRAGLLQVSPSNSYAGLTLEEGAKPGEPGRYYPTGRRTYARIMPPDTLQAKALVAYMRREGVRRVLILDDTSTYGVGLARLVQEGAEAAGIGAVPLAELAGAGEAQAIARLAADAGVDAAFYSGAVPLEELHKFASDAPDIKIFLPDASVSPETWTELDEAEDQVYFTAPEFLQQGIPEREALVESFRDRFGLDPSLGAAQGYEAMAAVLAAIERAGERGDERDAVLREFFQTKNRRSALGTYSIDENGDPTTREYGAYRAEDRELVLDHVYRR